MTTFVNILSACSVSAVSDGAFDDSQFMPYLRQVLDREDVVHERGIETGADWTTGSFVLGHQDLCSNVTRQSCLVATAACQMVPREQRSFSSFGIVACAWILVTSFQVSGCDN